MSEVRILVVGAGVIGISTAWCLQTWLPQAHVTVMAERFTPHTTSDAAFGFWEPHLVFDEDRERVKVWGKETMQHLSAIANSEEASIAGVYSISGKSLFLQPVEEPYWASDVNLKKLTKAQLSEIGPPYCDGYTSTNLVAECRYYLPWLMDRIQKAGGTFVNKKVGNLTELEGYDVIVNCTGIGSHDLLNDKEIIPIRGQVIRVWAPWVKHFTCAENDLYILPGIDSVLLGGTQNISWDTKTCYENRQRILDGCCRLEPSLKKAKVIGDLVGLRPGRSHVRLEAEMLTTTSGETCQVVHNYGHGGSGVTIHWGCALEASQLVVKYLKASGKVPQSSKL